MKYVFLSILSVCLTVIFCTWRIERMQVRRTMAAMQVASWRAGR